jgi:C4-dicarboxylate-specific signal transduction histidine kinase
MNDEIGREALSVDSRRISSRWHGIPIAVFLLGVLSIAMLMWMKEINKGQRENSGLADVIMDIQIKTALAHLWLEESLSEDVTKDIVMARSNLADAVRLTATILHGGKTEYYLTIRPPRSPDFLQRAEKASVLLSQFKAIAELRYSQPKLAGIGSDLDEHFDQVFEELHGTVKQLEDIIEIKEASDYARSTQLFYAIFIVWSLIVVAATAGIWHHESKRKRAENALQKANNELETRVAQRTKELRLVNDQLILELAERIQAEEALLESEKNKALLQLEAERSARLASLGELAAGVAHEINNPVSGIISCAEILVGMSSEESREHDIGRRITKEGNRIAYIVKSLLSFAREKSEEKVPVQVREILADTLALIESQMRKEGITLEVNIPDDMSFVFGQPQQIEQVFLNIVNNARDALNPKYPVNDEGKVLRITGQRVTANGRRHVRISFHDRGKGIPADILNKITNPFFTTKPRGKGTGLGLSISHGIIENHGGKLTIHSVEGMFTEVSVDLPLMEEG